MPLCDIGVRQKNRGGEAAEGMGIFYRTYGGGPVKVLLISGLAGTHECWLQQIRCLAGTDTPNDDDGSESEIGSGNDVEVCAFDNRGMGRSSIPFKKSDYTTRKMAKDAIALMDHLGWEKAHVFGHSMDWSCDRVSGRAFLRARTPEMRAAVDLETHYSTEYLEEKIENTTRRSLLFNEYVKNIKASGMQTRHGFEGQLHACWNHVVSRTDIESICAAAFPVSVIHGRDDIIAQPRHAKRLAEKLYPSARMVELSGGHQLMHERPEEVNKALVELIKKSKCITSLHEWTNISSRPEASAIMLWRTTNSLFVSAKLHVFLTYMFSILALVFSHLRKGVRRIKPIRVGSALT